MDCRNLCVRANFACRSFTYLVDKQTCLLSHHSSSTVSRRLAYKLTNITNIQTFELVACYDIELSCQSDKFVADIQTSRLFSGRVYLKQQENDCLVDVTNAFTFRFEVSYESGKCRARSLDKGFYLIDFVIQYYDSVVTDKDLWLSTTCQYDIRDQTLTNDYDLGVYDIKPTDYDDVIASISNIELSIVYPNGSYIEETAQVGDLLSIKIESFSNPSVFGFVLKGLKAIDPINNASELVLLENGCPLSPYLVSDPYRNGNSVQVDFKAFKYSQSDFVRFVAVVGACDSNCQPIRCKLEDDFFEEEENFDGDLQDEIVQSKPYLFSSKKVGRELVEVEGRTEENNLDLWVPLF